MPEYNSIALFSGVDRWRTRATLKPRVRRSAWRKLALIYGMRLLPEEELGEVKDGRWC